MAKKKTRKKVSLGPMLVMIALILAVMIGSSIISILDIEGSRTVISNGVLETSMVVVKNIFSREGIVYFYSNIITNFQLLQPLVLLIISLFAVSIGKESGFFKHLFQPLKNLSSFFMTMIVIFLGVISTFIGDYSYIILIPLVAVIYQVLGRYPVLGIITVFLGITLGYGTGIFFNYNDFLMGNLAEVAAVVDVDASYRYGAFSNIYIMIASTIIITFILTFLIDKYITKKLGDRTNYEDDKIVSKKALVFSLITLGICILGMILTILPGTGGLLLDTMPDSYIAKLFSPNSPFQSSIIYIFMLIIGICSLIYGWISKNFKNNHDFCWGFTKQFDNIGYLLLLLFLGSVLIGVIDWTNIGVVVITKLMDLLTTLNFSGIPLIIIAFIFIILMSVLIPGTIEKWTLISPLIVPLFMRANLTPDFALFIFKVADSIGKVFTPVFIYFIIMVGFIQKYNLKESKITLFGTYKLTMPIILIMTVVWLFILIAWYIVGLPLGIGTFTTM